MMAIAFNIRYDLHIQTRTHAHGGRSSSALCGAVKGPRTLTASHRDAHSLAQTLTASHRDCCSSCSLFPSAASCHTDHHLREAPALATVSVPLQPSSSPLAARRPGLSGFLRRLSPGPEDSSLPGQTTSFLVTLKQWEPPTSSSLPKLTCVPSGPPSVATWWCTHASNLRC